MVTMQLERVTLDAEHVGDPSVAPRDQQGSASWKPNFFSMQIPPRPVPSLARFWLAI